MPVRTKRRLFVPDWARELSPAEREGRLRAAGRALPEDRLERAFFLACTGTAAPPPSPGGRFPRGTLAPRDPVEAGTPVLQAPSPALPPVCGGSGPAALGCVWGCRPLRAPGPAMGGRAPCCCVPCPRILGLRGGGGEQVV